MKTLNFNNHTLVVKHIIGFGKLEYPDVQTMTQYRVYIQIGELYLSKEFESNEVAQCEYDRINDAVINCHE